MLTRNKLTKTLAFPIATGAAALGVLAGSVLTATSASAVDVTWTNFRAGTPLLLPGDKQVTYVSDTFATTDIPSNSFVTLNEFNGEYTVTLMTTGMITVPGAWTYQIQNLDPALYFTGVQVDSDVTSGYGTVTTFFAEPNITLTSVNGWPDPTAPGSFAPVSGSLNLLTVRSTLAPNTGGGLMSSSTKFQTPHNSTRVPEPGTILGLLTVGGLGLVSRFKKQK